MAINQAEADAVNATISDLSILNLKRLQTQEERISALAVWVSLSSILAMKHLLDLKIVS
jgi:hypothetical protein